MKIGRYIIPLLLLMGLLIVFGDKGLTDYLSLRGKLAVLQESNKKMVNENNSLKEQILLLRHDSRYIETIARNELGMVKQGDIVYRFIE
jgi:cell division protein FtsB